MIVVSADLNPTTVFILFAKALSSNCRRSAAFSNDLTGDRLKGSLNFVWETMDLNKLHIMWEQGSTFLLHFPRHTTAPLSERPCGMMPALRVPSKQPSVCARALCLWAVLVHGQRHRTFLTQRKRAHLDVWLTRCATVLWVSSRFLLHKSLKGRALKLNF